MLKSNPTCTVFHQNNKYFLWGFNFFSKTRTDSILSCNASSQIFEKHELYSKDRHFWRFTSVQNVLHIITEGMSSSISKFSTLSGRSKFNSYYHVLLIWVYWRWNIGHCWSSVCSGTCCQITSHSWSCNNKNIMLHAWKKQSNIQPNVSIITQMDFSSV